MSGISGHIDPRPYMCIYVCKLGGLYINSDIIADGHDIHTVRSIGETGAG